MGTAKLEVDSWKIIQIVKLDDIIQEFVNLESFYERIKLSAKDNSGKLRHNISFKTIDILHDTIKKQLIQLNPTLHVSKEDSLLRPKRGIFDGLGTVIKTITGNLDHTDALNYDKIISKLKLNQNTLKAVLSSHITLFQNSTTEITKNIQTLAKNQKVIEAALNKILLFNRTVSIDAPFYFQIIIHQIKDNFQLLFNILEEYLIAISFAKSNVFHNSIVNPQDLLDSLQKAEVTLGSYKFLVKPTSENLLFIEDHINIKSYIKGNNLVFILEVPLVDLEDFDYYQLIPIPVYHNLSKNYVTIVSHNKYVLLNEKSYTFSNIKCKTIMNKLYICKDLIIHPVTNDCCETNLLLHLRSNNVCQINKIKLNNVYVNKIDSNKWVITCSKLLVTEICNDNKQMYYLEGTNLIELNNHCTLKFGQYVLKTLSNSNIYYKNIAIPKINMPEQIKFETQSNPLNLNPVNLEIGNILQEVNNQKEMLFQMSNPINFKRFDIYSNGIVLILSLAIVVYFIFKYYKKKKVVTFPLTDFGPSPPNLQSQVGGVIFK